MGIFDFLKRKRQPPQAAPREPPSFAAPPFRATVTDFSPHGFGTLTLADATVLQFGIKVCRGFVPLVGDEVEVLGLERYPLGLGIRVTDVRLVSTEDSSSARAATLEPAARRRAAPPLVVADLSFAEVKPSAARTVRLERWSGTSAPRPELDAERAAGKRKVVTTRLENTGDGHITFRELSWDGRNVRIFDGRSSLETPELIDAVLKRRGEKYPTEEEARAAFEARIGRDLRHFSSQSTTVTYEPELVVAKFAANPELEAAFELAGAEERASVAQVFADWLQGEGDLRGELASRAHHSSQTYAEAFLAANAPALLGEVDYALGVELLDLKWSHGFLSGATLKRVQESPTDLATLTEQFLTLPLARFVTELRFGLESYGPRNDWSRVLAAVANSPRGHRVTRVCFDDYSSDDCELSWVGFGNFAPLWARMPALEWLHIRSGEGGTLGVLDLPNLRTFIRESGGLSREELQSIIDAKWPKLERLDVWFGSHFYGAGGSPAVLSPLLEGRGVAQLQHLGLVNCEFSSELLGPLLQSKILPRLKVLDLSKGVLVQSDVELLLNNLDRLNHLERLDVSSNLLDEIAAQRLKEALPQAVTDDQRDDYDEEYRYCAVGE